MINITTNPADWQPGETIVWGAVGAALDYDFVRRSAYLDKIKDVIKSIDEFMGIEHVEEEDPRLSFNAEIVLQRLQGVKICMDTDRHLDGIKELAQRGIIEFNKRAKGWRVKK